MEIKKFNKNDFGTLTTIISDKTGLVMFVGQEVAKMWGHTNLRQAVSRLCKDDEYKVIKFKEYPGFKHLLLSNDLLQSSNAPSIMLITESALYKLALASNLEKAKPFRDWVTSEVLPSIRKNGYYSIADQTQKILIHTNKTIQKQNSKDINAKNFIEGGVAAIIEYNRKSCLLHSGKTTKELKEMGKQIGLKSKQRTSAKEVLRNTKPEIACAMSFTDDLVKKGFDLNTVSELSKKSAIPLFKGMIEIGANPKELNE
ncbi:MAG TPA: BRO family protein [Bacteroidales bacterium]|nr:BRO family protein [Bacteroidales bacterium]